MIAKILDYKDQVLLFLIILIVIVPILTVVSYVFYPSTYLWGHLANNLLVEYLVNTFVILISVGIISLILGVSCAWLINMYTFPGKWGLRASYPDCRYPGTGGDMF